MNTDNFVASTLSSTTIDSAGGTVLVTNQADPLFGAKLVFPAGAVKASATVALSSARVNAADDLPEGAAVRSRAIRLNMRDAVSGAPLAALSQLVTTTLPTDRTDDFVAFYKVDAEGVLESTGAEKTDPLNRTVTFVTRAPSLGASTVAQIEQASIQPMSAQVANVDSALTYATYVAVGLAQNTWTQLMASSTSIDTGFRPSVNGWYMPNYGSYYRSSRGGNSMGMVGFAKYYHQQRYTSALVGTYLDAQPTTTWVDDATAIELASRVHNGMSDIWDRYVKQELDGQSSDNSCADPEVDGLWVSGAQSGVLNTDSPFADTPSDFLAGGPSWSNRWDINVPVPTANWSVPPSNTIMLP